MNFQSILSKVLYTSSIIFFIYALILFFKHSFNQYGISNYDIFSYLVVLTFAIAYFCVISFIIHKSISGSKKEKQGALIVLCFMFIISALLLYEFYTHGILREIPTLSIDLF